MNKIYLLLILNVVLFFSSSAFSTENPFEAKGEALFQEIGCKSGDTNEETLMGRVVPNSFCYVQSILNGKNSIGRSDWVSGVIDSTLSILSRECDRDFSKIKSEHLGLFTRACKFPGLYISYLEQKKQLPLKDEALELFEDWTMQDLYVGNYNKVPFSDVEDPLEFILSLILIEQQVVHSLQDVSELFRMLSPLGPSIEKVQARLQAAFHSYSTPKMMLSSFKSLRCSKLKNKGALNNCRMSKDALYLLINEAHKDLWVDLDEFIQHKRDLVNLLQSDQVTKDRSSVSKGSEIYSTRPEVTRILFIINAQKALVDLGSLEDFEFRSWNQEELSSLLASLKDLNENGGFLDRVFGKASDVAHMYRVVGDLVAYQQLREEVSRYQLRESSLTLKEYERWKNNHFLKNFKRSLNNEFKNSKARINFFIENIADEKGEL